MSTVSKTIIKPILSGSIATIIHKYGGLNQTGDYASSVIFGAVTGVSVSASELMEPSLEKLFKLENESFTPGRTVGSYIFQTSLSAGIGYSVNKFIFLNDAYQTMPIKMIGAIAVSNIISDLITDYM